jgi:hypothetical protein
MRQVTWLGGREDGAVVSVPDDTSWVNVLEATTPTPGEAPKALRRYTVPIIDDQIIWAQRVEA